MPRLNGTIDFDDVASAKAASASWWDEQDFDKIYIKDFGLYDFELTSSVTPDDDAVILIDGGYLIKITNTNPAVEPSSAVVYKVKNQSGATLLRGTVVYINGSSGHVPTVIASDYSSEASSSKTLGIIQNSINDNEIGYVVYGGIAEQIDTRPYITGTNLYLGANGSMTSTKPVAPKHMVSIGKVIDSASNGSVFVSVQNGFELDELHNVLALSPSNDDVLVFNSTTSLWQPKSFYNGAVISVLNNVANNTAMPFDGFEVRYYSPTGSVELRSTNGNVSVSLIGESEYQGGSFASGNQNLPLTSTFVAIGDVGLADNERITYTICNLATNQNYRVTVWRTKSATFSAWAEKIGVTTTTVLTAGYGLSLLNGVFSRTYESGDVIQRRAYSGTTALSGDTNTFTSRTMTMPTFTPKSANSTIDISIDADYLVPNYGADEFQVKVMDGATTIFEKRQRWHNSKGGGTRSPTLLPLQCSIDNTSLAARNFTLQINRTSGDDTCQLYGYRAVVFTESQN